MIRNSNTKQTYQFLFINGYKIPIHVQIYCLYIVFEQMLSFMV